MIHNFSPPSIHQISTPNISHLQNALQQISSWMTANLLTLNSSKTEFLLIELKQKLYKIQDCSLTTTMMNILPSRIESLHLLSVATITFGELRCIRPYLDFKTASTTATSVVHSKLDYCKSL